MWVLFAAIVVLASCNEVEETSPDFYFDSANYIENEVASLQTKVSEINKTVILNGEQEMIEHIEADSTVYEEMESLIKETNINKAKFAGEYTIDTFWMLDPITQENIEVLNYTTDNPELKIKWLQKYSNGSLKAAVAMENYLFSYEKEIYYEKGESFSVISWQKTLGQDSLHLFRSIDFL